MSDKIRPEIAKRRQLNKEHRNCEELEHRRRTWSKYKEQKEKVSKLVKAEIRK